MHSAPSLKISVPEESKMLTRDLQSILDRSSYTNTICRINARVAQFWKENSNPYLRTLPLLEKHGLHKILPPEEEKMPNNKNQSPKPKGNSNA